MPGEPATLKPYQVPALEKGLDVLEALAERPDGAAMSDLAKALGRSMGEIYRIVIALERRGYVEKDERERYALSLRLFELSHRHPPVSRLIRTAQPILDALSLATNQSCHLGVAEGDRLLVLANAVSPLPMSYQVKVGATFPLLETSSGAVILAFAPAERVEACLSAVPTQRRRFNARFRAVRERGAESRTSDVVGGVTNLTAPVSDHGGRVIAALTVAYLEQPRAPMSRDDVLARVIEAARALSRALGHGVTDAAEVA